MHTYVPCYLALSLISAMHLSGTGGADAEVENNTIKGIK